MNEYVLVVKEGLYWLAKSVEYPKLKGLEDYVRSHGSADDTIKLEYVTVYEIDTSLEHNGFEYLIDAYSYIVHIQDKEAQNAVST